MLYQYLRFNSARLNEPIVLHKSYMKLNPRIKAGCACEFSCKLFHGLVEIL